MLNAKPYQAHVEKAGEKSMPHSKLKYHDLKTQLHDWKR